MTNTVTRASLVNAIYREIGIPSSEAAKVLDSMLGAMVNALALDDKIKISSFGSFYKKEKNARIGRNPRTKKEAVIAPRQVVSFYASRSLKEKINN